MLESSRTPARIKRKDVKMIDLLEQPNSLAVATSEEEWGVGDWFVLHTKSRQEKVLASELLARDVANYLPLRRVARLHAGRKVTVEEPLFPGYVFLRGSMDDAFIADRTRRVARI